MRFRRSFVSCGVCAALAYSVGVSAESSKVSTVKVTEEYQLCRDMGDYGNSLACWKRWLDEYGKDAKASEVAEAERAIGLVNATEGFKRCQEMEDYGNATACWKIWLERDSRYAHEIQIQTARKKLGSEATAAPEASGENPYEVVPVELRLTAPRQHGFEGPSGMPDTASRAEAVSAEKAGDAAAKTGNCELAIDYYEKAYALVASERALEGAAACYEEDGQYVHAYDLMDQLLEEASASKPERPAWQAKLHSLGERTAVLEIDKVDPYVKVVVNGESWDANGQDQVARRVLPGRHKIKITKPGFEDFVTVLNMRAGEDESVTLALEPLPPPPPPAPSYDSKKDLGEVLDFCRLAPKKNDKRYQRQRLVLFEVSGTSAADGPEKEVNEKGETVAEHRVLAGIHIHPQLRETFIRTFPLKRFHTIKANTESSALRGQPRIALPVMAKAAGPDPFVAYSIACADWVAMPHLAEKEAKWSRVKRQRIVNGKTAEYVAWSLDITWTLNLDVYHRRGQVFVLASRVTGTNGGFVGAAFDLAAAAKQGESPASAPVSKRPHPSCPVAFVSDLSAFSDAYQQCGNSAHTLQFAIDAALGKSSSEGYDGQQGNGDADSEAGTKSARDARLQEVLGRTRPDTPSSVRALADFKAEGLAPSEVRAIAAAKASLGGCSDSAAKALTTATTLQERSLVSGGSIPEMAMGFAGCTGVDLTFDLGDAKAPGTETLSAETCKAVRDDVSLGAAAMTAVARCESLKGIERATLDLQNEAKKLEGWKLYAVLQSTSRASSEFGVALGRDEGVRRGDMYVAIVGRGPRRERTGFGRVVQLGPGGERGEVDPSEFKFRAGEAPLGTRMEEHPQLGILLGAKPEVALTVSRGELDSSFLRGGAVEGGYNASSFVPLGDEFWSRFYLAYLVGRSAETFVTIELVPEAMVYATSRLGFFWASGVGYTIAMAERQNTTLSANTEVIEMSGGNFGIILGAGMDLALAPDWNLRLGTSYRQGLDKLKLENEEKTLSLHGGTMSALQGSVSLVRTF